MTAPTAQRKSLRELRESTGTLFAKNTTRKKITCNTEQVSFELDPLGMPNSITIVPKECLNVPGFQRLWMKGAIQISDDETLENEIILQAGGVVEVRPKVFTVDNKTGQQIEVEPTLEQPWQSRDMVFTEVGDSTKDRGYGIESNNKCLFCSAPVFIQQKFLDDGEPPVCQDHTDRKGEVASTPQPDGTWYHQVATMQPVQKSNLPAGG